jgi:voltage-gated potassium channel
MPVAREQDRLDRWERAAEIPLLVAAVVFLIAYAVPIVWPDLPGWTVRVAGLLIAATWVLFAADFGVKLVLAPDRRRFMRGHWVELVLIVLPLLRPLRLLRLLLVLRIVHRWGHVSFRGRVLLYTAGSVVLVMVLASLAVLDAERGEPEATIQTLGDALWWALTTITTVGYGDYSPTTAEGRLAAALLMLAGIALAGVVTASLASWFIERLRSAEEAEERTQAALAEALAEMRTLSARLDTLIARQNAAGPPAPDGTAPAAGDPPARPLPATPGPFTGHLDAGSGDR